MKQQPTPEDTSKGARKRPGPKKKAGMDVELQLSSHPPSLYDGTPSLSRPASPIAGLVTVVYELDEDVPPLKKAKKMDDSAMIKRVKALEEGQRKVWMNIARREVAKVRQTM
jgi:DNA helicase INO80